MISCGDLIRFTLPALSLTRICPSFDQQSLIRLLRLAHLAFHNTYCLVRVRSSVMKTLEGSTNHVRCGISTCRAAAIAAPSVTSMKTSSPSPSFAEISPSSWEPPAPLSAAALASPEPVRGSSPCTMSGAVFVGRLAAVPSVHGVVCLRWLYHHVQSVSYISPKSWVCVVYYCAALWCSHIIEHIMSRWSYWCVCTSNYLIMIIMQTYLKVLICLLSLHIYLIIVRILIFYLIIIIKYEVWPICYCLGLGHETLVCAVSFYILTKLWYLESIGNRDTTVLQ